MNIKFFNTHPKKTYIVSCIAIIFFFTSSLRALDSSIFYEKLKNPIPKWMKEQIDEDLKPFTTELSKKNLDQIFEADRFCTFRIRVVNGEMTVQKGNCCMIHGAANSIIPHFQGLHHIAPLPDLDILISAGDGIGCHPNGPAFPIFTISKCKEDKGVILIPDWFALHGYEPEKSMVLSGNNKYPWKYKKNILFFRGGDSGIQDSSSFNTWKQSPRPQLVALSLKYPQLIDAKFALGLHCRHLFEQAKAEGFIGDYVSMQEYIQYKYLIDLDGNCASAPRLGLILHSNCVVLKAITNSVQWFYKALKPNVHFIPIKEDLSDLFTKMSWAQEHPQECFQISRNARDLADNVLSREAIYEYLYRLLNEYSKKQQEQYAL
ncbi:MAG: hypothetical protein K2Y01_10130 [Rhabdochlamydiaceae bacterium]|nr:hypothetical protein [Rhabdochlamydiaceae bacterium]